MDPYDDYDPKQYVYDEESSQEDDIVYLEGPAPGEDPFLPYLATDVELSQQTQSQTQPMEQVPNLLPRRERKRRQAAALMLGESSDSESSDGPAHNEGQDAFASLQSLLEKQSQKRKGTQDSKSRKGGANESDGQQNGSSEVAKSTLAVRAGSAANNDKSVPAVVARANDKFTQPEFPMADDWDFDSSQAEPKERTIAPVVIVTQQAISGSSVSLVLEKELQRQRKRKQAASQSRQMTSVGILRPRTFDANLKHRPPRQGPDWSKKRTLGGLGRPLSLSMSQAPVSNPASIVGSRPQHWGASRAPARPISEGWKHAADPRSSAAQRKARVSSTLTQPIKTSFLSSTKRKQSERPPAENSGGISFVPPFVHFRKSIEQEDSVEEVQDTRSRESERGALIQGYQTPRILQRFNLISNASYASYSAGSGNGSTPNSGNRRKKRSASTKLKAGPLMKRLRALRSAVDGDRVRFQSGMYPFASRRFDLSDPRNRATSYMDVSVVGEPVPWSENERVTVLGFIHTNEKTKSSDNDTGINGTQKSACFAWLSFTFETAREQKLFQGSQLRIYNAISLPTKSPTQIDGLGEELAVKDRTCNQTVICTQICESYPDSLPTLPSIT